MKKLLYAAVVLLYLSACAPDKFETIKVDNLYSLDVPSYMKKTNELHDNASLEYSNLLKEVYVIVLHESIDTFNQLFIGNDITDEHSADLNSYTHLLINDFRKSIGSKNARPLKGETINGLTAKTGEEEGIVDGTNAYFNLSYIQGKQYYYQVIAWTLASRKNRYKNVLEKITHSFKEL